MGQTIDIKNRGRLRCLLRSLRTDTVPLWGKMTPQQMAEHLVEQVAYANGRKTAVCVLPPGVAAREKQKWVYTDAEIPKNLVLKPAADKCLFPDMLTALRQLEQELDEFDHYLAPPGATAIHGAFGPLNYGEWVLWHNKHFTHHFRQFGLLH